MWLTIKIPLSTVKIHKLSERLRVMPPYLIHEKIYCISINNDTLTCHCRKRGVAVEMCAAVG